MTIKEFEQRAQYQNGYDRILGNWKVIDIHQIPKQFHKQDEVDFYCSDDSQVYLLRIRCRAKEFYDMIAETHMTYLIAEFPIRKLNDQVLEDILGKFDL